MIRIELLSKDNFHPDSLDHYQRKQEVKKVYRKQDGAYILADCEYTEDWDEGKRHPLYPGGEIGFRRLQQKRRNV